MCTNVNFPSLFSVRYLLLLPRLLRDHPLTITDCEEREKRIKEERNSNLIVGGLGAHVVTRSFTFPSNGPRENQLEYV